jgi:hypothetical protein
MSETEKKGSPWPWILVPVAAVTLFFVLRECQQRLPPAVSNPVPASSPAQPSSAVSEAPPETMTPAAAPAPQ